MSKSKVFSSFSALGAYMGVHRKPKVSTFERTCFKCGTKMVHVDGTNVWVCHGTTEDDKPCGNYLLAKKV